MHTILRSEIFYSYEVDGTPFVDWAAALIHGDALADVSCVDEASGRASPPTPE